MATQSLSCDHCGTAVPFDDPDRGAEVYCPSCGRSSRVPEADDEARPAESSAPAWRPPAEANAAARRATVFGGGPEAAADRVVRRAGCPRCGGEVPISVADIGGSVYCPQCGAEVPTGESLAVRPAPKPPPTPAPTASGAAGPPGPVRPSRAHRVAIAATALIGIAAVFATSALIVTVAGPATPRVADTTKPTTTDPTADITPEAIDGLLTRGDPAEALAIAEGWWYRLGTFDVPETDPRFARLTGVRKALEDKLAPPPKGEPAFVGEFRDAVKALSRALQQHRIGEAKIEEAKAAALRAEALLAAHPAELAASESLYLVWKNALAKIVAQEEGIEGVRVLLMQAGADARAGRPDEAARNEAHARFRARNTSLNKAEEASLGVLYRELAEDLKLARGRRAVEQAELAVEARDAVLRDRLATVARAQLSPVPDRRIKELWPRLLRVERAKIAGSRRSGLADEVEFQGRYEAALAHFGGSTDAERLIQLCLEARRAPQPIRKADDGRDRDLAGLVESALEPQVAELAGMPPGPGAIEALSRLRKLLDRAEAWKDIGSWRIQDALLRKRGAELTPPLVEDAKALAARDELEEAIRVIEPAALLGDEAVAGRAKTLRDEWAQVLKDRADRAEQGRRWARLQKLADGDHLAAWAELQDFGRRFPKSRFQPDLAKLRESLERSLRVEVPGLLRQAQGRDAAGRWLDLRRLVGRLESAPMSDADRDAWKGLRRRVEDLDRRAEGRFAQVKEQARLLVTKEQILAALDGLDEVLRLNPGHADALALRERARKAGAVIARGLLSSVEVAKKYGKLDARHAPLLEQIARLDPGGKSGSLAEQLRKGLR